MTDRKQQILHEAIHLLITKGHGALTMRAVAGASGLTLGALQYHYKTRADLVGALADMLTEQAIAGLEAYRAQRHDEPELLVLVDYMLHDQMGDGVDLDALFVQLWAMALVEPAIRHVLDRVYADYLEHIERGLKELGVAEPRADALVLMATLEGLGLLIGRGARWEDEAPSSVAAVRRMLVARYPELDG